MFWSIVLGEFSGKNVFHFGGRGKRLLSKIVPASWMILVVFACVCWSVSCTFPPTKNRHPMRTKRRNLAENQHNFHEAKSVLKYH